MVWYPQEHSRKDGGRGASGTLTTHSRRELCTARGCKASWVPNQPRLLFIPQKPCHILPRSVCSLVDKPSASTRHKEFTFNREASKEANKQALPQWSLCNAAAKEIQFPPHWTTAKRIPTARNGTWGRVLLPHELCKPPPGFELYGNDE